MAIERRALFALTIAFIGSIAAYPALPPDIPPYLYINGEYRLVGRPFVAFLLPIAAATIWWLLASLNRRARSPAPVSISAGPSTAMFLSAFHVTMLIAFIGAQLWLGRVLGLMVGVFLVATGNELPRLRPNLAWGIRTRQTLRSDEVWRRVHRLGGHVRVGMGLAVCVASLAGVRGFEALIVVAVGVETAVCVGAGLLFSREGAARRAA